MTTRVIAEIYKRWIYVRFPPLPGRTKAAKSVAGCSFVEDPAKGGPAFRYPLEMKVAQDLKVAFDGQIIFGPELQKWGREQRKELEERLAMVEGTDAGDLERLPAVLPALADFMRPYQRRGARYIARPGTNPYVCDHPGLGKTVQVIGGIYEEGIENGPKLIIAPKTSLDITWLDQLVQWQDQPVFVADEGRESRDALMEEIMTMVEIEEPFWLVLNPAMITLKRKKFLPGEPIDLENEWTPQFPELFDIDWNVVAVDEVSRAALINLNSGTARGIHRLKAAKRIAMEGTPVRGRPVNVWTVLHWLEPEKFKAKWRWAEQWLGVEEERGHKKINNSILNDDEEGFYKAHAPYILRRTKREVAPDLPDKIPQTVWVEMGAKQAKQYAEMEVEEIMRLAGQEDDSGKIPQTSVLNQIARLKQFSGAFCDIKRKSELEIEVRQTEDSCKLPALRQVLEDRGILDPDYDSFPDSEKEQIVIFSQFSKMAEMVHGWLGGLGVPSGLLIGDTKRNERRDLGRNFQKGGILRALVMTTTAGGVSITLDRASTVVFLDETWIPDDQEQAEDRVHRISRIHQVHTIRILTKNTIEEEINSTNTERQEINGKVLDFYRLKRQEQ